MILFENDGENTFMNERENYLNVAGHVAEYLSGKGCVEKVGITGSLAEYKEDPYDIDLLVIVPNECALKYREMLETHAEGVRQRALEYLGLSQDEIYLFISKFGSFPLDILILSNNPDDELIKLSVTGLDSYFLLNILNRALFFNVKTKKFERQAIYPQHTIEKMNEAAMEVLKGRMNDEAYIQKIERSFSSRRRRQREITLIPSEDLI